jgi:hypothetical protein
MIYYVYDKTNNSLVIKTQNSDLVKLFDSKQYRVVMSDVSYDYL